MKLSILTLMIFFLQYGNAQITIDVDGNWHLNIHATEVYEAGSNLQNTYTSSNNAMLLDVYQSLFVLNLLNYNWKVDIGKIDTDWHPSLTLWSRRTGNGTPYFFNGSITGGTIYQEVKSISQHFFSGSRSRLDIPLQFQVRNISLTLPVKTYNTTIVFTVTEL